jgi:zona occludens toxin (predicted ATPase)
MSMMMGGSIDRFDFIGFLEVFHLSVKQISRLYGLGERNILWLNGNYTENYAKISMELKHDKPFVRRVKKIHKQDFELYQKALEKFGEYHDL